MLQKKKSACASKKDLIEYIVEASSKFMDILLGALTHSKAIKYTLFHENDPRRNSSTSENISGIMNLLITYNKKLKSSFSQFKKKKIENSAFTKIYESLNLSSESMLRKKKKSLNFMFDDLIDLYHKKKNYSFSNDFMEKNIFLESPLLLLTQEELNRFFTFHNVINGINSANKQKVIFFLKRIKEDLNDLLISIGKMKQIKEFQFRKLKVSGSSNEITREEKQMLIKRILKEKKEGIEIKREIKAIEKLIKPTRKEDDKKNADKDNNPLFDKMNNNQRNSKIFNRRNNFPSTNSIRAESQDFPTISQSRKRFNTQSSFSQMSTVISKEKKKVKAKQNYFALNLKGRKRNLMKNSFLSMKEGQSPPKTERIGCDLLDKSQIEKIYENLKKNNIIQKERTKAHSVLNTKSLPMNSMNTSGELMNSLSELREKIEKGRIRRNLNKIYNGKLPEELEQKLSVTQKLDIQIKKFNLVFVKDLIEEKVKESEIKY